MLTKRKPLTQEQRIEEIRGFVDICFANAAGAPLQQIADRSGISYTTIWRLQHGGASLFTRIGTVQALGFACGLKLVLTKYGARIALSGKAA